MTDPANLPPLIQRMLQPDFYPHAVQEPIQLFQTHVSYVVTTGNVAYKLKKAVDFGFLDYSTLEKRHHFCNEEMRLNERGAGSALYLGVVPISEIDGKLVLGSDRHPVEYAVKMKQFPQDTLLSKILEQGELTEDLLRRLAVQVADFHRKSVTSEYIRSFGTVEQVRQAFDENYEQTTGYIGGPQTQQQFDETQAYTDRFFAERQNLFKQRMQQGYIRECHGDLHLRNICYWHDELLLFDCIEFNEPFRFVDVMYDIAYIVMDLDVRQRPDLRAAFLNAYVEETGDWEGLLVLPIYVSRQTYVRAKVASFLLDDPLASEADKKQAYETAARYYKLVWEYTQTPQGHLILMTGLSGSGKTTTAREVVRQSGVIHIRSDAVRKHLGGISIHERGDDSLYTPEMTKQTYDRLLDLGISLAQSGYTVVLDAKYDRQTLRQAAIAQATAHNLPLQILHCTAPIDVLSDRVHKRSGDIADATVEVLAQQTYEPLTEAEQPFVVTIDTTCDIQPQIQAALA
jgi:aminoglycoside phosphotransferase family enzyme/gluconate kinase